MLEFTSIVGYTSCGPMYIESFLTIFGQCINVLNYKIRYLYVEHTKQSTVKISKGGIVSIEVHQLKCEANG